MLQFASKSLFRQRFVAGGRPVLQFAPKVAFRRRATRDTRATHNHRKIARRSPYPSSRAVSSLLNSLGLPEPFDAFMHCPTR